MTKAIKLPASKQSEAKAIAATAKRELVRSDDREKRLAAASFTLSPTLGAARVVSAFTPDVEPDEAAFLMLELRDQCAAMQAGNLGRPEAMLLSQAHSLDAIFNRMARLAAINLSDGHLKAFDTILRLGLRAQAQSRCTLETLAAMKNPPVVFARQANITSGPQQINNGVARAEESTSRPNKLLEREDGQSWLDTGTASAAGGCDPIMATLDEGYGAEDRARKGTSQP